MSDILSKSHDDVTTTSVPWRERMYKTCHVTELLRVYQLSQQLTATIDYASSDQLALCQEMMSQAALTGDNVGTDEYPDDESYEWFFMPSEMFTVTKVSDGHVVAFIAIEPCRYARGSDTCLAHLYIFRSADITTDWTAFQSLVRLAVQLTVKLELGYTECVYSACLTSPELLRTLRAEQFTIKAILPKSINIAGKGLRENVIMTKDLGLPHRPPRPLKEVLSMWNKFIPMISMEPLQSLDFLPRDYVFGCGLQCTVRSAVESDVTELYALMTAASERGQGYALYEFPSFDYFRRLVLGREPCVVYEEKETGRMIGYSIISDSFYVRTKIGGVGESDTMISEKYRGRNIGSEVVNIELTIMKQLGRTAGINDAMISNAAMLNLLRRSTDVPTFLLGALPKSAFHPTVADGVAKVTVDVSGDEAVPPGEWEDSLISYYEFQNSVPTFTELADSNASMIANKRSSLSKM